MKTISNLISDLRRRSIKLSLSADTLCFTAPIGALASFEKDYLRSRHREIESYLRAQAVVGKQSIVRSSCPLIPSISQEMWWRWAINMPNQVPQQRIHLLAEFQHVDLPHVESALRDIITRHHTLRSSFRQIEQSLLVTLNSPDQFCLETKTLRNKSDSRAIISACKQEVEEFRARSIPLDAKWLICAKAIELPQKRVFIAIGINHIVADASSRFLLSVELRRLLIPGMSDDKRSVCKIEFGDYAANERDWISSSSGTTLIAFWKDRLNHIPALFTRAGMKMEWKSGNKHSYRFNLNASHLNKVRDLAIELATTTFFVYLTLFSVAIARWSSNDHFAIRCLGNLRTTPQLSSVVGLLICADTIEICLSREIEFATVLKTIEIEYRSAVSLRVPTLHMVLPHVVIPTTEDLNAANAISATVNYMTHVGNIARDHDSPVAEGSIWPPIVRRISDEFWPIRIAPIYFELTEMDTEVRGLIQFNDAILSPDEQEGFIAVFFDTIAEFAH